MEILLVRHCSATGQPSGAELTPDGIDQAKALAEILSEHKVRRIISSPFKRAVDSAKPAAENLGISIEIDPRLVERELGETLDGNWMEALRATFEDPLLCFPGGESSEAATARGRAAIEDVFQEALFPTAVFTHGNLLALTARSFDGSLGFEFWKDLQNPDLVALTHDGGKVTVKKVSR